MDILISEIGERRRIPVTYEEVPQHVVLAFVAAEDRRFFVHPGIDYRGVLRALSSLMLTGEISGRRQHLNSATRALIFLVARAIVCAQIAGSISCLSD